MNKDKLAALLIGIYHNGNYIISSQLDSNERRYLNILCKKGYMSRGTEESDGRSKVYSFNSHKITKAMLGQYGLDHIAEDLDILYLY